MFNLRHSQLRNCVERVFGVFKAKWKILSKGPQKGFYIKTQFRFVYALAAVSNFAKAYGQSLAADQLHFGVNSDAFTGDSDTPPVSDNIDAEHSRFRDRIATAMWEDYQAIRTIRRRRGSA